MKDLPPDVRQLGNGWMTWAGAGGVPYYYNERTGRSHSGGNPPSAGPSNAPHYMVDQGKDQLLLESLMGGGSTAGDPTGISVEPGLLQQPDYGSPSVGGNIGNYAASGDFSHPFQATDFGGPFTIGGDLPGSPMSGPSPVYGDISPGGQPIGFDSSVNFGDIPAAPLSGPTPNYANSMPGGSASTGGTSIRDFGGNPSIGGDLPPAPLSGPIPDYGSPPSAGTNTYDAGGGQTYIYDSNWNYIRTDTAPTGNQTQPTTGNIPSENFEASAPPMPSVAPPGGTSSLSDPSFYPGGGTAFSLDTPGGIPIGTFGQGGGSVAGYGNNRPGPLSPANYNWFFSPTATGKPPIPYQDYVASFGTGGAGNYAASGYSADAHLGGGARAR